MHDWNVVVSVHEGGFAEARKVLKQLGPTEQTEFFNILVMRIEGIQDFLERLREQISEDTRLLSVLARVIPVTETFDFQHPGELGAKAAEIVLKWVPDLAGKGFHVRMHRRGFKGRLSSMEEEQKLDELLLDHLEKSGAPGKIMFDNPDLVIALETVGQRAGLSMWTREQMGTYTFLRLDS